MIIGICSLCIAIIGWFVNDFLSKRKQQQYLQNRDQKDFVDRQLSKLYGPVYGILLENDRLIKQLQIQFDRKTVFYNGVSLTQKEEKIWVHMLENFFLPNNRRIVNLILQNVDLLESNVFPNSFLHFIDYAVGFELLHKQDEIKTGIPNGFIFEKFIRIPFQKLICKIN